MDIYFLSREWESSSVVFMTILKRVRNMLAKITEKLMWRKIKFRFPAENVIMCHLPLKLKKIIENGTEPWNTDIPIDVIRAANPLVWRENHLKR